MNCTRKIFNIDVGNMSRKDAEKVIKELIEQYHPESKVPKFGWYDFFIPPAIIDL